MRIFFPIGFFFPAQTGGPNNSIYWLAKALKSRGFDVVEVAMDYGIPTEIPRNKWLDKEFGRVMYVKTLYHQFAVSYIFKAVTTALKAQIVHLTGIFAPTSFAIGICCFLLRKSMVWSVRGEFDTYALNNNRTIKKIIIYFVKVLNKISSITFHSTCLAETNYIRKVLGDNTSIIEVPNYMELPKTILREKDSMPYFLYIGRHHSKKGLDNLIKGVALSINFINSNYMMLIAGEETLYTNYLKDLVSELNLETKIMFIGELTGEAKEKIYSNAYFTVFPSHTENFGNVVIESLAQGTPVIASKGTPWEVLEQFNAGFWIDNEPENIKSYIDNSIKLPRESYLVMRDNARKLLEDEFDISKKVDVWIKHYQDILNTNKQY